MVVKADRTFFCILIFITKTCDLDLLNAYAHELSPAPWAITTPLGIPLKTNKAKLLKDIDWGIPSLPCPQNATWIIDACPLIPTLKPVRKQARSDNFDFWETFKVLRDCCLYYAICVWSHTLHQNRLAL